ncbi:LOW QUALITY PROTEIN: hypothetical protein V1477_006282 [Vespula maculifrons]|uniref:Uncharacterized protein n=1 Tax=Vespula maculifrons TaxID=7453 RepID=A0ABD2CK21_VESMC
MGVKGATSPFQRPESRSPSDPGPVLIGAIVSEKKIVKEKCFFPWFPLNRYNSAPIGPIWKKNYMGRARRALSNNPGRVLLPSIVPEKKIVKEIFFFPLFSLNSYNSAPIGPICTQKIWAQWARQALSNDPGPVLVRALVSEKKIRALRELTNDPGRVLVRALVSEKKIVKEKCFFPLFPLNCYNSAPIGPIWTRKMWAYPGSVLVRAIVSEKKIVKEKCFFPLFPLNYYNPAPIGPIWTKKIWA